MLRNSLYAGQYRDNENYCTPLIPPEEFWAIQEELEQRSLRTNQSGRVYLFSGLVTCALCGQAMTGNHNRSGGREYSLYRCRQAVIYRRCDHRRSVNEGVLEQWLLARLGEEMARWQVGWQVRAARPIRPKVDRVVLRRKLEKLKDLYVNDLITLDQYRADHQKYTALLAEPDPTPEPRDLGKLVEGDFLQIYQRLEGANKRAFWRGVVRSIVLDGENRAKIEWRVKS